MTDVAEPAPGSTGGLRIPSVAWSRPIGLACDRVSRPRVPGLIDDGEWAGVPIGGLGSGSIGRSFRGDVSRWHLEVGRHAFRPVAADGFSVFVERSGRQRGARPLDAPPGWRAARVGLRPARRRRDVPRAVPAGVAGVRAGRRSAASGSPASSCRRSSPTTTSGARSRSARTSGGSRTRATRRGPSGCCSRGPTRSAGGPTESPVAGPRQEAVRDADGVAIVYHDGGSGPAGPPGDVRDCRGGGRRGRPGGTRAVRRPVRPRPVGGLRGGRTADRRRRRRGPPAGARRRVDRRRGLGDRHARARRGADDPVRGCVGPAGHRVRRRAALVEAAHARRGAGRAAGRWTSRATRWRRRRPGGPRSRRGSGR